MELKYLDFMVADGTCYRIKDDNIVEFNMQTKTDYVDCSLLGTDTGLKLLILVDSLLLVIKDYSNIEVLSCNVEDKYNPDDTSISYISIEYENGETLSCFVDMSNEDYNRNQLNSLKDKMLFISIEDNKNF